MSEQVIVLDGLSKSFGDVHAVEDLSLAIEPGTIFGFSAQTAPEKPPPCGCFAA